MALVGGARREASEADEPPLPEHEERLGREGRMARYMAPVWERDPSAPDFDHGALAALDRASMAQRLRELGASDAFAERIRGSYAMGEPLEALSAAFVAAQATSVRVEIALGGGGKVAGGTDLLPRALAAALGARVRLGARVDRVEHDAREARVHVETARGREALVADRVLVTVPPAVIAAIAFAPGLSAAKERAADGTRRADVVRVFAQVEGRPWRERGEVARVESDGPLGSLREESTDPASEAPVLGFYVDGPRARALDAASDADVERLAREEIERAHPGAGSRVRAVALRRWTRDPFARGAYAYFAPGTWVSYRAALAQAEGRVHFAGDATSHRPGFMHGAVRSAHRAVAEIDAATRRGG